MPSGHPLRRHKMEGGQVHCAHARARGEEVSDGSWGICSLSRSAAVSHERKGEGGACTNDVCYIFGILDPLPASCQYQIHATSLALVRFWLTPPPLMEQTSFVQRPKARLPRLFVLRPQVQGCPILPNSTWEFIKQVNFLRSFAEQKTLLGACHDS